MELRRDPNDRGLFRLLVQAVRDYAIFALDPNGHVVSWNLGAERINGYTLEEILGQHFSVFYPRQLRTQGHPELELERAAREGRYEEEGWRVRKDGSQFWARVSITAMRDETGRLVGFGKVTRDLTERRRAEEQLRQAKERAERASEGKSELLARTSHELRTPLNAILGFGQLLESDPTVGDQESVTQILAAGRHLLSLVDEVLDLGAVEAGRINLTSESVSVSRAVEESLALVRPLARQRGISLEFEARPDTEPFVHADPQRLKEVLLNLLSNAIKYNREGGSVSVCSDEPRPGRIHVAVRDTGPGIPAEDLKRLCVPFERLDAEIRGIKGTGLGLALTKGLVESMQGRLWMESEVGRGSTFRVELPRAERPRAARAEAGSESTPDAEPEGDACRTVLYIEDNVPNARLVERVLARRPHVHLMTAPRGGQGLDLARRHHPHLILLDMNLPDVQGDVVLERLQADPATSEIPVVILSSDARAERIGQTLALGVTAYLTKPLDVGQLLAVVDDCLAS